MVDHVVETNPPSPAARTGRLILTADAVVLREMEIVKNDIESAIRAVDIIVRRFQAPADLDERQIAESLLRDAITQFVGCFEKGRYKLSADEVFGIAPQGAGYLEWLKNVRNSYAAHSPGPLRQCPVLGFVDDDGAPQGVITFAGLHYGMSEEDNRGLLRWMSRALEVVSRKTQDLIVVVQDQFNALSNQERLELPIGGISTPTNAELTLTRKQFDALQKTRAPQYTIHQHD